MLYVYIINIDEILHLQFSLFIHHESRNFLLSIKSN